MVAMQVILLERVEKLGQMGDVVLVRPGYARNFLLPQKKALRATKENLERFEKQRAQLEATNLTLRTEAEIVAKKIDGTSVVLVRQAGESGQLFGSVTARDIAEAVGAAGFTVAHRQIRIERPIKTLGMVKVRVMLHPEVAATVTVNVAKSEEEAQVQASAELFEKPPEGAEAAVAEPAARDAADAKPKGKKAKAADADKADGKAGVKDEAKAHKKEAKGKAKPDDKAERGEKSDRGEKNKAKDK